MKSMIRLGGIVAVALVLSAGWVAPLVSHADKSAARHHRYAIERVASALTVR